MAKVMIGLAIGAAVLGAKVMLHPSLPSTPEGQAKFYANGFNAMAPRKAGPIATMIGAKSEGVTLELDHQLVPNAPALTVEARHDVAVGTCGTPGPLKDFIAKGGVIRSVYTTADGQVLPPVVISSCPTQ